MENRIKYTFFVLILLIFNYTFSQSIDSSIIKIVTNSDKDFIRYQLNITNNSDSLMCILFSGFQGPNNITKFELPLVETYDKFEIYKLTISEEDKYIDPQCGYYHILTINPKSSKEFVIYIKETGEKKKLLIDYMKINESEKKFIKKIRNKNCLGNIFKFRTIEIELK